MTDTLICQVSPDREPIALIAVWLLVELGDYPSLTVSIEQPDVILINHPHIAHERILAGLKDILTTPRFAGVRIRSG